MVNSCGCGLVSVVLGVQFGRFGGVMGCVVRVAMGRVRVVSGSLVVARLMVPGGFAMMLGRSLVVFRCLAMMRGCLF
jgi:hypothetical protein